MYRARVTFQHSYTPLESGKLLVLSCCFPLHLKDEAKFAHKIHCFCRNVKAKIHRGSRDDRRWRINATYVTGSVSCPSRSLLMNKEKN